MAMHAAPRAPRRPSPKPSHPTTAVLVLVLAILGLASQCDSPAETSDSAPTVTVPSTTSPPPLAEAPQPAGNEMANGDRSVPAKLPEPVPVPTRAPVPDMDSADADSGDNGSDNNGESAYLQELRSRESRRRHTPICRRPRLLVETRP